MNIFTHTMPKTFIQLGDGIFDDEDNLNECPSNRDESVKPQTSTSGTHQPSKSATFYGRTTKTLPTTTPSNNESGDSDPNNSHPPLQNAFSGFIFHSHHSPLASYEHRISSYPPNAPSYGLCDNFTTETAVLIDQDKQPHNSHHGNPYNSGITESLKWVNNKSYNQPSSTYEETWLNSDSIAADQQQLFKHNDTSGEKHTIERTAKNNETTFSNKLGNDAQQQTHKDGRVDTYTDSSQSSTIGVNRKGANNTEHSRTCDICGKKYSTKSNMRAHQRVHTANYPYKCNVCNYGFAENSKLKRHMVIHSDTKPYECYVCFKAYKRRFTLNRHLLEHRAIKPFECSVCGMEFVRNDHMQLHMQTHYADRIHYICMICGKQYLHSWNLERHKQIKHLDKKT